MMSQFQTSVSIGLLLGDAWLQTQSKKRTYRFRYEQGDCHREYFLHIAKIYSQWLTKDVQDIQPTIRKNIYGENVLKAWRFCTRTSEDFSHLRDLFYPDPETPHKKILSEFFVDKYIDPISLAYWFMDDGGKLSYNSPVRYGLVFNTHSFSEQEVEWLVAGLKRRYNLDSWMKYNKGFGIVAISGKCYNQFLGICGEYIHESMYRKLPCKGSRILKNSSTRKL